MLPDYKYGRAGLAQKPDFVHEKELQFHLRFIL